MTYVIQNPKFGKNSRIPGKKPAFLRTVKTSKNACYLQIFVKILGFCLLNAYKNGVLLFFFTDGLERWRPPYFLKNSHLEGKKCTFLQKNPIFCLLNENFSPKKAKKQKRRVLTRNFLSDFLENFYSFLKLNFGLFLMCKHIKKSPKFSFKNE